MGKWLSINSERTNRIGFSLSLEKELTNWSWPWKIERIEGKNPMNRYDTSGLAEDMFEPGSNHEVLKNKLGITDKRTMDETESKALLSAFHRILGKYGADHRFSIADLCDMHRLWLGDVYEWAGKYRTVNISKGEFTFAMARHIPTLMDAFEKNVLNRFTPCSFESDAETIHAVSVVHVELLLIHPFRDGNGRISRLLAVVMGLQAGYPPFDFSCMEGDNRTRYFSAVQEGMRGSYQPMETIFKDVLSLSSTPRV